MARDSLPREAHSSLRGLQLQLDELGNRLLCKAVLSVLDGTAQFAAQTPGSGQTFRKPTLAQQAALKAKLRATASSAVRPTGVVKEVCFALANAAQGAVLRPLIAPRVTVVLYHRVTDAVRDNLSVGVEQFARQMALLKRHFEVLGIEEVLALQAIPRSSKPLVAVTFDDGYLDNYTLAVPILLRHQIPAAFFVSTGLMGTDKRFPHDVRRSNPAIPVMGWDHLREMKALGFTLGSHSVEHIDCAAESELRVRAELRTSRQALESELGLREVVFAYPYGGRQHMTAERLELVKQAGYIGCLSAYGGSNVGVVDRFNVLRKGINHEFSDRAFVWQCLGLR